MKEYKITEEQIKVIANEPDWRGSLMTMKSWFPEAFEPEWEEVSLINAKDDSGECMIDVYLAQVHGKWETIVYVDNKNYFIREGKIWRRKA